MSLLLLLTTDPSLQKELELGLSPLPSPPTIIQAGSWGELDDCLDSVRDVSAVVCDTRIFPAPDEYDLPIIQLSEFGESAENHPTIHYPFDEVEVLTVVKSVLDPPADESPDVYKSQTGKADFVSKFIKEITHGLNNQFTILRGQLPLIKETCPEEEETISDLIQATERATTLTHMLESMDPDTLPVPDSFNVRDLLIELNSYGKKIIGPSFSVDLSSDDINCIIQGDQALVCLLLLQCAWLYSFEEGKVNVRCSFKDPKNVQILFKPDSKRSILHKFQVEVKQLNSLHHSGHISLKLIGDMIVCSLPR